MIDNSLAKELGIVMAKFKNEDFDLILHTPGGDVFASMLISRMLKEYKGNIRVIIPFYAMSGGTLLALSCDELYLGQCASLGPLDPQLGDFFKFGSAKSWRKVISFKGKRSEDSSIRYSMLGEQVTQSMIKYLNDLEMLNIPKKKEFINRLTSGDIEHIYPFTIEELKKYDLPVKMLSGNALELIHKAIKYCKKNFIYV
jgi:ClpP class serine protease